MQSARVVTTEEHRFCCCKGNTTGDPDLVNLVSKTDWIVPEARVGLTKPELRSFCEANTRFMVGRRAVRRTRGFPCC